MNFYLQKNHSNLFLLIICLVSIFCITGCSNLQSHPRDNYVSTTQKTLTAVAGNPALTDGIPDYENGFAVSGWPGRVFDFPADSEYDNYLMWLPEGSGETGISGVTNKIDATLMAVADSQKTFLFWGLLTCNERIDDYRNCRLEVTDLQPAGSGTMLNAGSIEGWSGQIIYPPDNNTRQLNFVLSGQFPLQFILDMQQVSSVSSFDEPKILQKNVHIWGNIVNGGSIDDLSKIIVTKIEVLDEVISSTASLTPEPVPALQKDISDWPEYSPESLHLSFKYPPDADLTEQGTLSTRNGDIIDIVSFDQSSRNDEDESIFTPLCVRLEYGLGYIAITSAVDLLNHYTSCSHMVRKTGTLHSIEEEIILFGETVTVHGFEYTGDSERLTDHYEIFHYELTDGSLLEFGSLEVDNQNYQDYKQISRDGIFRILQTFYMP